MTGTTGNTGLVGLTVIEPDSESTRSGKEAGLEVRRALAVVAYRQKTDVAVLIVTAFSRASPPGSGL